MAKTAKIRIGSFSYTKVIETPNGDKVEMGFVANQGEEVELSDADYEKGERLNAFGEPPKPAGTEEEETSGGEFDPAGAGVDEIATHIEENNLTVEQTVALAEGQDDETVERIAEAEESLDSPRKGVLDALE